MWARKAPYHYGWDWGPRFVTSGIWRPARSRAGAARASTTSRSSRTSSTRSAADLTIKVRVVAARAGKARVTVTADGKATIAQADVSLELGSNEITLRARIDHPELWWPNGLGAAAALRPGDDADGGRRRAGNPHHAHRPADRRGGARARQARKELHHQGERRAGLHEGGQLDPRRQLRHPDDRRALSPAAAVGRRRAHEHAPRLGRRDLRRRSLLRARRRAGPAGLAGLHVRLLDVPGRPGLRRKCAPRGDRERPPPAQPPVAGALGRQQRERGGLEGLGLAAKFDLSKTAQDRIWRDYKQMFHEVLPAVVAAEDPGRFYTRSSPSANEDRIPANKLGLGRHALLGRLARREPLRGLRRQHLALHERVRLPVVPRARLGRPLHRRQDRLGHRQPGDAVAPAAPARQRADQHVHGARLPRAQGLRRRSSTSGRCCRRRSSSTPPRRTGGRWGATGAASTGSSTTAGRSPPGPASTTTGAGRRCSTPRGASSRRCWSRPSTTRGRSRSGASPIAAPTRRRGSPSACSTSRGTSSAAAIRT